MTSFCVVSRCDVFDVVCSACVYYTNHHKQFTTPWIIPSCFLLLQPTSLSNNNDVLGMLSLLSSPFCHTSNGKIETRDNSFHLHLLLNETLKMGPKAAIKRQQPTAGHKVVVKNGTNKPSIVKQPARNNRPSSGKGDKQKVVKSSASVTKIIKQDFQRPAAQKQKQPRQPSLQPQQLPQQLQHPQQQQFIPPQLQPQQQFFPPQLQQLLPQQQQPTVVSRGRGPVGQGMYHLGSDGGSMALQTAQAVASNRGHPKHQEVGELLNTMNKGWIDQGKFAELLQGILF